MQKSDILRLEQFSSWFDFATFAKAKESGRRDWAQLAPPSSPGVYFFATSSASRLKGESDLFYIGKADNLRNRIGKHLYRVRRSARPEDYGGYVGSPRSPEQGVASLVEEGEHVEVGWLVTKTKEAALRTEAKLLADYKAEHGELPPNNRVGG